MFSNSLVQVFVNESLQSLGWVDASWSDPNGRPVPYICSLLSTVLTPQTVLTDYPQNDLILARESGHCGRPFRTKQAPP